MPRRRPIFWTGPAIDDLRELRDYVSADDPRAARALAARFRSRLEALRDHPELGRVVPELAEQGYRELVEPPYRLVYQVEDARIVVLRVRHGRRDLSALRTD